MRNRILAIILTFTFVFGLSSINIFAAGMSFYPEQGTYEFEEEQIGEKFIVDFILDGNEGYNNSTFRVKYDPSVIKAVPNETSDVENDGFITYDVMSGKTRRLFFNSEITSQLNLVPSKGARDYEGRSDGKKTAAETGIIVLGQYVSNVAGVYDTYDNGIFIRLTFEIMGPGETDIEISGKPGSSCIFYATSNVKQDVSIESARVKVTGSEEESIETTTKSENSDDKNSNGETITETTTKFKSSGSSNLSEDDLESTTKDSSKEKDSEKSSNKKENKDKNNSDDDRDSEKELSDNEKENSDKTESNKEFFNDISNYAWAEKAINDLAELKIINGIGGGKFAPQNNVKRADFLIMLMNALGIKAKDNASGFADVDSSKYYANAVTAAQSLGIAAGDDKGNFRPEEFISRQDMMVLAYRALVEKGHELESEGVDSLSKFNDKEDISEYAKEALNAMVSQKIVNGTGNNIEPKNNTTRAQSAVIIHNILKFIDELN